MKTRIITAIVALAVFAPVLYFAETAVFPLMIGVVAAIAGYEMASCAGLGKRLSVVLPTGAYCFLATLGARPEMLLMPEYIHKWHVFFMLTAVYLFYMLCVCVFAFGKIGAKSIMSTVGLSLFAAFSFFSFVSVRDEAPYDYLLILIAAWATDTFAIFGGALFGKKKLAPKLSPKKTVAGMFSGVVGAVVGFAVYNVIVTMCFGAEVNWVLRLALAVPASFIGQLGDLVASAIKRDYKIKDYGKLLPGHGGVVDRFDSVMFLSCATFLFICAAKLFVPELV